MVESTEKHIDKNVAKFILLLKSTDIVELFKEKSKVEIRAAIKALTTLLETDVVIIYEKVDNPQEDQLFQDPQLRLRVIVEKYFEQRAE